MPNVNIALALLFFLIVAFEMFVLDSVLKYAFPGGTGLLLKLAFYGLQFVVLLSSSTSPIITATRIYT